MNATGRSALRFGVATVLGALLAVHAAAQDTAREWFERMGSAVETLTYRGTLVHTYNNQLEMLEVLHKVENGRVFERVTSLNGSGREVVREGDRVRCIDEQRKQVLVDWGLDESPLRAVLPTYDESLERHYRFKLKRDAGKVGGRQAHLVAIEPRDHYRYGYRLWLDRETAMPLLCELLGAEDDVIEAVQFTRITFGEDLPDELFAPRLSTTDYSEVAAPEQNSEAIVANDKARWRVAAAPPGFTLSLVKRHDNAEVEAEHLVFTDGVASISIFAESYNGKAEVIEGIANIGTANAFGRRVGGFQITVVGEVPAATVKQIGDSIEPVR